MLLSLKKIVAVGFTAPNNAPAFINATNDAAFDRKLAFKNDASFISSISKINNTLIGRAEDVYVVMPMCNLLKNSKNYSKTTGNLWNYYKDGPHSGVSCENNDINYSIKDSKSFDCKTM